MVKKQIKELLNLLGFHQDGNIYTKKYETALHPLQVDVEKERIYYDNSGITVTRSTTSNFSEDENLVVLECVDRLLSKGYQANHIELEPHWKLGHGTKGGYADHNEKLFRQNAVVLRKMVKMPRGKKETIEKYEITLPSLEIQKEVVKKLRKLDGEIKEANQQIANSSSAKQAILDKYLK